MILFSRWICSCNASSNCFNCCKTKRKLAQASSGAVNPLVNEEIFQNVLLRGYVHLPSLRWDTEWCRNEIQLFSSLPLWLGTFHKHKEIVHSLLLINDFPNQEASRGTVPGLAITLDDSLNALRLLWLIMLLFADLWHGFPDGVFSIRSLLINRWAIRQSQDITNRILL